MTTASLNFLSPHSTASSTASLATPSLNTSSLNSPSLNSTENGSNDKTHEAFQQFVAGTFFQQMFKALRDTQQKPKYFHGGQAEEIFQGQLDQQVSEDLAKKHGDQLVGSLYDSFVQNTRARIRPAPTEGATATETATAAIAAS